MGIRQGSGWYWARKRCPSGREGSGVESPRVPTCSDGRMVWVHLCNQSGDLRSNVPALTDRLLSYCLNMLQCTCWLEKCSDVCRLPLEMCVPYVSNCGWGGVLPGGIPGHASRGAHAVSSSKPLIGCVLELSMCLASTENWSDRARRSTRTLCAVGRFVEGGLHGRCSGR